MKPFKKNFVKTHVQERHEGGVLRHSGGQKAPSLPEQPTIPRVLNLVKDLDNVLSAMEDNVDGSNPKKARRVIWKKWQERKCHGN